MTTRDGVTRKQNAQKKQQVRRLTLEMYRFLEIANQNNKM